MSGSSAPTGRSALLLILGAIGALAPLLVLGYLALQAWLPERDPQTLEDWIEALSSPSHARVEAAVQELAARGRDDPERVVPAVVEAMRAEMGGKYLAKAVRAVEQPVRMLVVVDQHEPDDPRHVLIPASPAAGEEPSEPLALLVPRLPIGRWIFNSSVQTFTVPTGPLAVELLVQREVQEAFRAFTTRHLGHELIFVRGSRILARYVIEEPVSDVLRFVAPPEDAQARENLSRIGTFPSLSFHDGHTEAGRALALMGEVVIDPLEVLAREDELLARAAAWARWRLHENLRETGAKQASGPLMR